MSKDLVSTPAVGWGIGRLSFRADWAVSLLSAAFVAGVAFFSLYRLTPPNALPASAAPTEFSAGRAMRHIEVLAQRPHPTGSPELANLNQYLLNELKTMGLEIETEGIPRGAPLFHIVGRNIAGLLTGNPLNIVARLKGTDTTKAVLLVAHYDSSASALNASDGGAGVGAILETLRALKAGPPLRNDVMVLFTDGEELDMMGARAFADYQSYIQEVGVAFNFVARGTSGPAIMFETSAENGWLIEEFAKAAPYPVASSLAQDVYSNLLPNATDFTYLKLKGMPGLNFAYIGNHAFYDTVLDNPQNVDPRSLQHLGASALAMARHFGQLDLGNVKKDGAVYFDVASLFLVHYPKAWVIPLTAFVSVVFAAVMAMGFRRKALNWPGLGLGFLAAVLAMMGAWAGASLSWQLNRMIHPDLTLVPNGDAYNTHLYLAGFVALTIVIVSAIWLLFRTKISAKNLAAGALAPWWVLMLLSSFFLPGASYLFTWPLLFGLLSLAYSFTSYGKDSASIQSWAAISLGALPGLVMLAPTIYLIYIALTISDVGLTMLLVALVLGLLVPHAELIAKPNPRLLPATAMLASVGFMAAGGLTGGFNNDLQRKPNTLAYYLDSAKGQAYWITPDPQLDEWTSLYIKPGAEKRGILGYDTPFWFDDTEYTITSGPAPVAELGAPQAEVLSDTTRNGVRTLKVHLSSARRTEMIVMLLRLQTPIDSVRFLRVGFYDQFMDFSERLASRKPRNSANVLGAFSYHNPPPEGVDLTVEFTAQPGPIKLIVYDLSHGIPEMPGANLIPRPDYMMPSPMDNRLPDAVLVSQVFDLP